MVKALSTLWLVRAACVAFLIFSAAAMLLYPGSTFVDPATRGYRFFENFFSDTGMTRTWGDQTNFASALFFVGALFCAGGGMILFFARLGAQPALAGRITRWSAWSGMLTGFCFFGIALSPQDLFSDVHDAFSVAAFFFLLSASLGFAYVLHHAHTFPRHHTYVFGLLALLICSYIILFLLGPPLTTYAGMVMQAVGQKVIVYAVIFCLLVQLPLLEYA